MWRRLSVIAVSVAVLLGIAAPANAASTAANTLTTRRSVTAIEKSMAQELGVAATGCALNYVIGKILSEAKAGENVEYAVAIAALKYTNSLGSGFCGAWKTIARAIAETEINFDQYRHVYIRQTSWMSGWGPWQKLNVTRWIGRDASHTSTISFSC